MFIQFQNYAFIIRKSLPYRFGIFVIPMKNILAILAIALPAITFGQCKDIYGTKCDCPSEQDSLTIYNNALKIMFFFDENKHYKLVKSTELVSVSEKREIFDRLVDARRYFSIVRQAAKNRKPTPFDVEPHKDYKDITYKEYYQEIDEYRFYQRELENEIVNSNSDFPMYDIRIQPILVNEYVNEDSTDPYFGDLVQIPLYVPVVVKPYELLTGPELALRNKILHIAAKDTNVAIAIKPVIRDMIKRDSTVEILTKTLEIIPKYEGTPIYCYNMYGSGSIIGFIQNRVFVRIKPEQYKQFAVTLFAQELLSDMSRLHQYLFQKFGSYIVQIL